MSWALSNAVTSCSEERIILLHSALMPPHLAGVCTSGPHHLRKVLVCVHRKAAELVKGLERGVL